jgi:hypothetical protein
LAAESTAHVKAHPPTPIANGAKAMSKEQKSNKEEKKKPALSPKEKKAAKKTKKDAKG